MSYKNVLYRSTGVPSNMEAFPYDAYQMRDLMVWLIHSHNEASTATYTPTVDSEAILSSHDACSKASSFSGENYFASPGHLGLDKRC